MKLPYDILLELAEGHITVHDAATDSFVCKHPFHSEWDKHCWLAQVNLFAEANPNPLASKSTDEFAQKMVERIEGAGKDPVLLKYVFLAEAIDEDGFRGLYTASTDDATAWDELGLISTAKIKIEQKIQES